MRWRGFIVMFVAGVLFSVGFSSPAVGVGWDQEALSGVPRVQWNANYGYCGETSVITAGLRLGQYTSQWSARDAASPGVDQTREESQLLLGVNDVAAAKRMRLTVEEAPATRNYLDFMTWVRGHVAAGDTVIIGVYNNTTELGEGGVGDSTYDHIVPVYGYESVTDVTVGSRALPSDVVTISDNGLRTVGSLMPMLFSYRVGDFRLTRAQANAPGGATYSLPKRGPWYGVAVTGVADRAGETLPVTVRPSRAGEGLQNQPVLSTPPEGKRMKLSVMVDRGSYDGPVTVYEYDSFDDVPVSGFAEKAGQATRVWRFAGGVKPSFVVDVKTSDTRVFRAVRG